MLQARISAFESATLAWILLIVGGIWMVASSSSSEPYQTLSCLALNVRAPTTAWMNMGYWTPQLSHRVVEAAGATALGAQAQIHMQGRARGRRLDAPGHAGHDVLAHGLLRRRGASPTDRGGRRPWGRTVEQQAGAGDLVDPRSLAAISRNVGVE